MTLRHLLFVNGFGVVTFPFHKNGGVILYLEDIPKLGHYLTNHSTYFLQDSSYLTYYLRKTGPDFPSHIHLIVASGRKRISDNRQQVLCMA